jgi:hypothetical protein
MGRCGGDQFPGAMGATAGGALDKPSPRCPVPMVSMILLRGIPLGWPTRLASTVSLGSGRIGSKYTVSD